VADTDLALAAGVPAVVLVPTLDVAAGEAVEFTLTVTNAGDESVALTFRDGLTADFTVLDGDREVWRWSDDRMATQAVRHEELAPGESLVAEAAWHDPAPGAHVAVAELRAAGTDCEARAGFEV